MSQWPAFEKDEAPRPCEQTEQECSWLLPQSLASLAGELAATHEDTENPATFRLITWMRSVSTFHRDR